MNNFKLSTPVAFFIFNNPDTTQQVFAQIKKIQPPTLLVIADGPRSTREDDKEKCQKTRAIIEQVNWDCNIIKNYSEINLGCKNCLSKGLNWVFNTVDEAIILEHDTLPDASFFPYCQTLLEKYRNDDRIMMISGCNFQFGKKRTDYSYYFSKHVHCWGWATWQRAWKKYDVNMSNWPEVRDGNWLLDIFRDSIAAKYWQHVFDLTYQGFINTWDYQWVFSCLINNALNILPNTNLISNIGFGINATHTNKITIAANIPTKSMPFPLKHPPYMIYDMIADNFTQQLYNTGAM